MARVSSRQEDPVEHDDMPCATEPLHSSSQSGVDDDPERSCPTEQVASQRPGDMGRLMTEWASKEGERFLRGPNFGYIVTSAVLANIVLLAVETDYPDFWAWGLLDFSFLLLFASEIVCVVVCLGPESMESVDWYWMAFDGVFVALGVFEILVPLIQGSLRQSPAFLALRLLRLLRLIKSFRYSRKLAALAMALVTMIERFAVIFMVLFLFILTGAIFCTEFLGHSEPSSAGFSPEDVSSLQDSFGEVYLAVFSLFQIATLDNWMDVAGPAAAGDWRWQLFFITFIVFGSWTMISILTAVASDSMVSAASDREEVEAREREALREDFLSFLREAFLEADADGNGVMDSEEFAALIKKESVLNYMSGQGVGVTVADLERAWETLDAGAGRTGEHTIDEFVTGFLTLSKGISTHDIANVEFSLRKTSSQAAGHIQRLTRIVQEVRSHNEEVISALERNASLQREQLECMSIWREWAQARNPDLYQKAVDGRAAISQDSSGRA